MPPVAAGWLERSLSRVALLVSIMANTSSNALVGGRFIVVVVTLVVILGLCLTAFYRQPKIEGESLGDWVGHIFHGSETKSRMAVQAMGTNAVPFFLDLLRKQRSPVKSRIDQVTAYWGIPPLESDVDIKIAHSAGAVGFLFLGPVGRSAAPAVAELLLRPDTQGYAAMALSAMEPDGIVELLRALTNGSPEVRRIVGLRLGGLLDPALPAQDWSFEYREPAPTIGPDSDIVNLTSTRVVPALIAALHDPDPHVRWAIVHSLRRLGLRRETVVEEVRRLLEDENPDVRSEVEKTIQKFSSPSGEPESESKAVTSDNASASP